MYTYQPTHLEVLDSFDFISTVPLETPLWFWMFRRIRLQHSCFLGYFKGYGHWYYWSQITQGVECTCALSLCAPLFLIFFKCVSLLAASPVNGLQFRNVVTHLPPVFHFQSIWERGLVLFESLSNHFLPYISTPNNSACERVITSPASSHNHGFTVSQF